MMDKERYNKLRKKQREENKRLIAEDEDCKIGIWYTKEEDKFILDNLYKMPARDIGYALGKTQTSIYHRVQMLREKGIIKHYKTSKMEEQANSFKKEANKC